MRKITALLLAALMLFGLCACSQQAEAPAASVERVEASFTVEGGVDNVYHAAYIVYGQLEDGSPFDSAEEGLAALKKAGRIDYVTVETDGQAQLCADKLRETSESGEYDVIILGTGEAFNGLREIASAYPNQKYVVFGNDTGDIGGNVLRLGCSRNELGYLAGVFAACVTADTSLEGINEQAVIGFLGGEDSPAVNDYLVGFIKGAGSVDPDILVETRYTENRENAEAAKALALGMIEDCGCDVIWSVTGKAGTGAAEAALETGKARFIGAESDWEVSLSPELSAVTLTSGTLNIGSSLIWFFDELDAGNEYYGTEVLLGLAEGSVGLVTDKNYAAFASEEIKAAVADAKKAVSGGTVIVDTAVGENAVDVDALRESVRP